MASRLSSIRLDRNCRTRFVPYGRPGAKPGAAWLLARGAGTGSGFNSGGDSWLPSLTPGAGNVVTIDGFGQGRPDSGINKCVLCG